MNIRRLTKADLIELEEPTCNSTGCGCDAHWEVAKDVTNDLPNEFARVRR
jgi:hypothetical protein